MSEADVPKPRGRRRAIGRLLGLAVAAVLVAVVIKTVPWQDTLTLRSGEQTDEVYAGEIIGSWRGSQVEFRFEPVEVVGPLLRGHPLAQQALEGGLVQVDREQQLLRGEAGVLEIEVEYRPGMPRAFADLELLQVLPALGFLFLATLFVVTRWWRLLLLAGCPTRWREAFRLTYVGLFFNTVLPGSTGGDLVRAYVVVRGHRERRADALTSVGADRVLGLVGMAILSTAAIWTNDERFAGLRIWVLMALVSMVGVLFALVNPWLRALVRFDSLLPKLPQGRRLAKIDRAVRKHAEHPGTLTLALVLSICNHICSTACCYWIGHAFGDLHSFHDYLCVVTVANTVSSLPLSPGGLGVGEVAFGTLLSLAGGMYMIGVATSFVYRLSLALLGLGGGLTLLLPGGAEVKSGLAEVREGDHSDPSP